MADQKSEAVSFLLALLDLRLLVVPRSEGHVLPTGLSRYLYLPSRGTTLHPDLLDSRAFD